MAHPVRLLCLLAFFGSLHVAATSNERENDQQALLCFKSQLSGTVGTLSSWSSNTSMEFCSWHGVSCSEHSPRRVIALDLASEGITGTIPPCIANLTSLTRLQLANNSFRGSISRELGLLSQLRILNLSMNSLEGTIPSELSSCSQLQALGLWNNSLRGEIPPALGQCVQLEEIDLSNNDLEGSIPSRFGALPELRVLESILPKIDS